MQAFPTIGALQQAYKAGKTVQEVIDDIYAQIAAVNDPGIFITLLDKETVLENAKVLGTFDLQSKPLWGIPFAVKDNIDVAGIPTTAACPAFSYTPKTNAFAVQRLIEAGALAIGKTNLDQFATGLVGVRTPYPVPKNAVNPDYVPGGSSSGSAVAVAHGIVSFALGTDTAGSGRVPAGLNNIVGLKPTLGSISSQGVVPACQTLDTISIFSGCVADAESVHQIISVYNPEDPWSKPLAPISAPSALPPALRIAIPDAKSRIFGGDKVSENAFIRNLEKLGASDLKTTDLSDFFSVAQLLYQGPWVAERYQAIRTIIENTPDVLYPVTRDIISSATQFSAADTFASIYQLAALRRKTEKLWQNTDVLIVPTFPRPRTVQDLQQDPITPNSELGTYTNFVNLLDLCALAVPSVTREDGLPSSLTLIAPRGKDSLLAALGKKLHARAGVTIGVTATQVPEATAEKGQANADEMEIVVVGAHLSGMALNHELTSRGARFLRAGSTTKDYKLYALAGGPPLRPGLMRVAPNQGQAIQIEVWAMPTQKIGSFIAGIPAPLGIGSVALADGTTPKGFIMEAIGLDGATDISHLGGWRSYIASLKD